MPAKQKLPADGFYEVYHSLVDLVYMTKINRIARRYSSEEVSFLIGKHKNYVAQRESLLPNKDYRMADIYWLAMAYDMDSGSMIMSHPRQFDKIRVRTFVEKQDGVIKHTAKKMGKYRRTELLYQFYEYDLPIEENERDVQELEALTKLIRRLLAGVFFDNEIRSPLEIFRHCKNIMKKDIRPRLLEKALAGFLNLNRKPALKRYYDVNEGYLYKKINGRSVSKSKK